MVAIIDSDPININKYDKQIIINLFSWWFIGIFWGNTITEYPVCLLSEFVCANKLCVPLDYVCDSDDDCRDGSDEQNCPDICDSATQVIILIHNISIIIWVYDRFCICKFNNKYLTKAKF